jgi:uncharacterized SAM-binding protein YcdF (DUF218 family)
MNTISATPKKNGAKRGCLAVVGGIASIPLIIIVLYLCLWAVGGILIISDPLEDSDAIVLLSGGDPERWSEAARLYKKDIARRIILTETEQKIGESNVRYILLVRNNISAMGVPMDNILITSDPANSTFEEAQQVLALMQARGFQSCVVVTDPFHTFRTRLIFQDVFKGSGIEIKIRSVQGHWYQSATWMFSQQGRQTTILELSKTIGYVFGLQGPNR